MKTSPRIVRVFVGICLACMISVTLRAQVQDSNDAKATTGDLTQRLEGLEKQIERLRAELALLKKQQAESPPPLSTTTTSLAPSAEIGTPPPAAPSPLAKILGSTSFSGFMDGYYGYNLKHPHSRFSGLRAFDGPSNQFALNMIELILDKPPDASNSRLGFHFAAGFGQAMNVVNATDPGGLGFSQYLKEAYFSYLAPVGQGLQFDFGKFVTPHGAEVIETRDNWNYSRGLLFTYAIPFYHFGLRARYSFNARYAVTGYVVNGWNNVVDNNTGKTVGVTLAWNPTKKVSVVQNFMAGPEQPGTNHNWRQLTDTVVSYSPTSRLALVVNFDYGRGDRMADLSRPVWWSGVAGYVRYAFDERYALATRYEYYDDRDGFTTGTAQHLNEFTGTFERRIARHLITRLEYRRDFSNRPSFLKGDTPVTAQDTVAAGLVYTFDTRESQ